MRCDTRRELVCVAVPCVGANVSHMSKCGDELVHDHASIVEHSLQFRAAPLSECAARSVDRFRSFPSYQLVIVSAHFTLPEEAL